MTRSAASLRQLSFLFNNKLSRILVLISHFWWGCIRHLPKDAPGVLSLIFVSYLLKWLSPFSGRASWLLVSAASRNLPFSIKHCIFITSCNAQMSIKSCGDDVMLCTACGVFSLVFVVLGLFQKKPHP